MDVLGASQPSSSFVFFSRVGHFEQGIGPSFAVHLKLDVDGWLHLPGEETSEIVAECVDPKGNKTDGKMVSALKCVEHAPKHQESPSCSSLISKGAGLQVSSGPYPRLGALSLLGTPMQMNESGTPGLHRNEAPLQVCCFWGAIEVTWRWANDATNYELKRPHSLILEVCEIVHDIYKTCGYGSKPRTPSEHEVD